MKAKLGVLLAAGALGMTALLSAAPAQALQQPDGTTIPQTTHLVSLLNAQGESINPLTDAATTPQTFTPTCGLTFTLIARGAPVDPSGLQSSFGWYNVTGQKPALSDLHIFISCSDPPGTSKVLDVKNDPAYLGGDIGFFEATPEGKVPPNCVDLNNPAGTLGHVYYTEAKYNEDNTGPNSYIHVLIMNSTKLPNSFYFGWEDLYQGGDDDFEDILVRVDGIHCTGGGQPCDTGQKGVCAAGTMQCKKGQLTCVPVTKPGTESCNALDDNCDGQVDEGDLCPVGKVCDRGKCVPKCGSGEFQCPGGLVCNTSGLCVDSACESVVCKSGEICKNGTCHAACDGITCPYGEVCQAGACIDPCDAITCDQGYVCHLGVCTADCSCEGCKGSKVCDSASKLCVDKTCVNKNCAAGTHCESGQCVDDCAGASCPGGGACVQGKCQAGDGGAAGGAGGSGGGFTFEGGVAGSAASSSGGGSNPDGGGSGGVSRGSTSGASSGCGCRVSDPDGTPWGALVALLGAIGLFAFRRRR